MARQSNRRAKVRSLLTVVVLCAALTVVVVDGGSADTQSVPRFESWTTYSLADGLPSEKIFALAIQSDRLWVGTEDGLAVLENGNWRVLGVDDGLAYPVITDLTIEPETGDLWIGTFGGLSRLSGGQFENFNQLNSGLVNDVIYAVAAEGHRVWAATAAGTSVYDSWKNEWQIFTNRNAPMHEIWCYGLSVGDGKVHLAVWGGGVLQFDLENERWREHRDPDREMEIDLLPDDGPVSDVVASVSYKDGILWAGTYFGANRYDGRRWQSYSKEDSGLPSNFINKVVSEGKSAWFATDDGLSHFDGETWTTYRAAAEGSEGGEIKIRRGEAEETIRTETAIVHNFVLTVARRQDEIWVGTEKGLSVGRPIRTTLAAASEQPQREGDSK